MSRTELRLAGLGGQGIVMLGRMLATAAIYDGKEATQVETYGMQQRGGEVRSDVVISDEEIDYPEVTQANMMIALSQEALDRYQETLGSGGTLVIDSVRVQKCEIDDDVARVYGVPATEIAEKELGNPLVVSAVMLGAVLALTGLLSQASTERAIVENVPKKALELNLKAFRRGLQEGAKHLDSQLP